MMLLKGHGGKIGANALVYSPDGTRLASGAEDGTAIVWDLAAGKPGWIIHKHERLVTGIGWMLGGTVLATGSWDQTVRFWDVAKRKQIKKFDTISMNFLTASPDGLTAAAAGTSGWFTTNERVHLFGAEAGTKVRVTRLSEVGDHDDQIGALAFSPDGKWLASGAADKTTRLWRLPDGEEGPRIKSRAWIQGLAFSPDGKKLAVAAGQMVKMHDALTGEELGVLARHRKQVLSVAFTPSGRTLMSGSKDGTVCCWDVALGKPGAVYRWKVGPVEAVTAAPDGMTAAAGGAEDVVVWDLDAD